MLPARRLQDNVAEVTIDLFRSWVCVCAESEPPIGKGNEILVHSIIPSEFPAFFVL